MEETTIESRLRDIQAELDEGNDNERAAIQYIDQALAQLAAKANAEAEDGS